MARLPWSRPSGFVGAWLGRALVWIGIAAAITAVVFAVTSHNVHKARPPAVPSACKHYTPGGSGPAYCADFVTSHQ